MTLQQFAQQIVDSSAYRNTIMTRAQAGTLPPDVELFLLETAADVRPLVAAQRVPVPQNARTLAIIRPPITQKERNHEN